MKVPTIRQRVTQNFQNLISKINRTTEEEKYLYVYALNQRNAFRQTRVVDTGYSKYAIIRTKHNPQFIEMEFGDGGLDIHKKPFYMTTRRAYSVINNALQRMLNGFDKSRVEQSSGKALVFTEEMSERLG